MSSRVLPLVLRRSQARVRSLPLTVAAVLAFVLGSLALAALPAGAQDDPDQVVIFVLDLSGSMNEPFGPTTKLDVAKAAFVEAFTNVAPDALVGLRTYGDQIEPTAPADREPSCTTDTRLVSPIAPLQRDELIGQVEGFTALGDTPMGLAIEQAATDVPEGAVATIVLFSDGRDECFDADLDGDPEVGPSFGDDPCLIAKQVVDRSAGRIDRIVTVGFGADEVAESQLRCIAESTGGSYTPISTPEDARDVLPELLVQFSAPRQAQRLEGIPIVGTAGREGAPEFVRLDIENASSALYTDSIAVNSQKVYSFPRFGPGPGTFTATVFGLPAVEGIAFEMRLLVPELDAELFEEHSDLNAGLPSRTTASIRCTDCSVQRGPHDVFWVVSLRSEDESVTGDYALEIVTEGPGFGGPPSGCQRPQECWYPHEIASLQEQTDALRAEIERPEGQIASPELVAERDDLEARTAESQASLIAAEERIAELSELIPTAPQAQTSYRLPLLMLLAGVGLAVAPVKRKPKSDKPTDDQPDRQAKTEQAPPDLTPPPPRPTTPSGIVLPPAEPPRPTVTAKATQDWTAELAAAKDALVQQGPTGPRPGPPTPVPLPAQPIATTRPPDEPQPVAPTPQPEPEPEPAAPVLPPPGWYRDPANAVPFRWWDGAKWTTLTSETQDGAQ